MSDEFALSFTTALKEAKKFKVDGEAFEILGVDHLSAADEAEVTALFARYGVLQNELEITSNVQKGIPLAEKIKATRIQILCKLTTMPKDVAAKLHLTQQVALLETLAVEDDENADEDRTDGPDAG